MMRLLLILCVIFLFQQDENMMLWSESSQLTWNNFKGQVEKDTDVVATTASGITFSYSIKKTDNRVVNFSTIVLGHFYPDKSWVKQEKVDNHILAHEQLHFDITELHVRKFKHQIEKLRVSNAISLELDNLHQEINVALSKMQNNYDSQSDYSRNLSHQAEWEDFVKKELQKLSNYKS